MANKYFKQASLTMAQQDFAIHLNYSGFKLEKKGRNHYVWIGDIQPTTMSSTYTTKLDYKINRSPKIYILSPPLRSFDEKIKTPHMYDQKRLCVYLPRSGEWTNKKLIAITIIPWISLWLFYYEIWLSTGEWLGGGLHSNEDDKKEEE